MSTRAETSSPPFVLSLLRAAHLGPSVAVTTLAAVLAVAFDLPASTVALVTAAVLAGQLTIGWGNDLVDADRDREVGRRDKPLANHDLPRSIIVRYLVVAACVCVVLSLLAGWRSGAVHLLLGVTSGHLYNLYLKSTPWSWLPYAVAFGSLPAFVSLANEPPHWPPVWMIAAAATLGVAAHFLNTLPDLHDDTITGVRGLPHRLGAVRSRLVAATLLVAASALTVFGPAGAPTAWAWAALAIVLALAVPALAGRAKIPFCAAVAIALVNVVLLAVVAA